MVQFANGDWAKNLTIDEDNEKTLHQRIEMSVEKHTKKVSECMQSVTKLRYNLLGYRRLKYDQRERFAQLTDGETSLP